MTENYHNFKQIGQAVLTMTAAYFGKDLSEEEQQHLLNTVAQLSPHPDVEASLRQLKEAGFRLVTLTNSANETLTRQMEQTGLGQYFEAIWSVDNVQLYKPHPQTYQLALSRLQLAPQDTMMVAAHGWDITGAAQAGMQTAFIARQGQSLYPLAPAPTLIGDDLAAIARQLIAL